MASTHLIPADIHALYEVHEWRNACAVLSVSYPREWHDVLAVLREYRLYHDDLAVPGGRKTKLADRLDDAFRDRGWREASFDTAIRVQQFDHDPPAEHEPVTYETPTHKVDIYRNRVGLELEWNNKDPFFDRDLNNFRLLFELKTIDVGIIVTRTDELQEIFDTLGRGDSYGSSTTHISKLLPKIEGGGAGGCPILVFGMRKALYKKENAPSREPRRPPPRRRTRRTGSSAPTVRTALPLSPPPGQT